MNLRQLEAFRAVMRAGSVGGAARAMNLSQPSVSRLVGDLERSVGFKLFLRSGRGIIPTVEARRFHISVESMLLGIDRIGEVAAAIRDAETGDVALGVNPTLALRVLPRAVAQIENTGARLNIQVTVVNPLALIEAVALQKLEFAVVSTPSIPDQLHILHDMTVDYLCLVPEGHRLARQRGPIDLNRLSIADFVMFDSETRHYLRSQSNELAFFMGKPKLASSSSLAVATLALATGRLALVDPFTAAVVVQPNHGVLRPIRQKLTYRLCIIARAQDTISRVGRQLAAALVAELDEPQKTGV